MKDGKIGSHGILKSKGEFVYLGEFVDGMYEGKGKFVDTKSRIVYEG